MPITSTTLLRLMILIFSIVIYAPRSVAAESNMISLQMTKNTNKEVIIELQGVAINKPLIGISTNLRIPNNLVYTSYDPGEFFEQTFEKSKAQVTYLIGPKKNDPHTLIIGIASLGQTSKAHDGRVVTLHFTKKTATSATPIFNVENAVASGVIDQKRVDYQDIVWNVDSSLAQTGSNIFIVVAMSLFVSIVVSITLRKMK